MTTHLADTAVTPAALLARVRTARSTADAAEAELFQLAAEWADAHPVLPGQQAWKVTWPTWTWLEHPGELEPAATAALEEGDVEAAEWHGIPPVRWDAAAAFAAANNLSTTGGQNLVRDALVVRHRLPLLWRRVIRGEVPAWRARRIAQAVLGAPADVVAHIDAHVTPVADTCGLVTIDRLIEEALQRLHAEEREEHLAEQAETRYARVEDDPLTPAGLAAFIARGDYHDIHALDRTVAALAAALSSGGCEESLDVRRSMALGILADPATASALLAGDELPAPSKRVVLYLHLSHTGVLGLDPVGRCEVPDRAVLEEQVRGWCGRTDVHLTVRPVIDLADHHSAQTYEIPDRIREQVILTHPTCVFPWCTRSARASDLDHITPYAEGGTTDTHNLAPLCRRHHRLKTHTAWTYRPLDPVTDPGVFLWTDPHALTYLRTPTGTRPIPTAPD